MTAQIAGFDTRAEVGLYAPTAVSTLITPGDGGVAVHWGGDGSTRITGDSSHAACRELWRAWQDYHVHGHGWWDIAYTGGFCQHGYALAGRGYGRRTAANGTNDANQRFYAVVWLGCSGDTPTDAALDALDWWLVDARHAGSAGNEVKPHRAFFGTECPGDFLTGRAGQRDGKGVPKPKPDAPGFPLPDGHYFGRLSSDPRNHSGFYSAKDRTSLKVWQARAKVKGYSIGPIDGLFGARSERVAKQVQRRGHVNVDGLVGANTWPLLWK